MGQNFSDHHYHVYTFEVAPADLDLTQAALIDFDYQALQEEDLPNRRIRIRVSLKAVRDLDELGHEIRAELPDHSGFTAETVDLRSIQFQPPTFEPIEITDGIWVVPPDEMPTRTQAGAGKKLVILPSTGFGTGRHPTTQLTGDTFWKLEPKPKSVLDIGTGSGILAILARMRGVPHVDAVEIDELSRLNALENFELNGINDLPLYADLAEVKGRYEVVLANILSSTILELKSRILELVAPGGFIVLSGILDREGPEIEEAFADLKLRSHRRQGEWLCYCYQTA